MEKKKVEKEKTNLQSQCVHQHNELGVSEE